MKKGFKRTFLIMTTTIITASLGLLFLRAGFGYNKNKILAVETEDTEGMGEEISLICEKIDELGENELEIPIGKATDQTEYLADKIVLEAQELADNTQIQVQYVRELIGSVNSCDSGNCSPHCDLVDTCDDINCRGCREGEEEAEVPEGTCFEGWVYCCDKNDEFCPENYAGQCREKDCRDHEVKDADICDCYGTCSGHQNCCCIIGQTCEDSFCTGNPCPATAISVQAANIQLIYQEIRQNQENIALFYATIQTEAIPRLEKSENRLNDCAVRPYEEQALLRGEISGQWLVTCRQLLNESIPIHSYLPSRGPGDEIIETFGKDCYGNDYCRTLDVQGQEPPYDSPACAEDYYCCYFF